MPPASTTTTTTTLLALLLLTLLLLTLASIPLLTISIPRNAAHAQSLIHPGPGIFCTTCAAACAVRGREWCEGGEVGCGDWRDWRVGVLSPTRTILEDLERCWAIEPGKDEWGREVEEGKGKEEEGKVV